MLPANKRRGSPTGGGNFYIFKAAKPEAKAAALTLIKWMTAPERTAEWSIKTGYMGTRPDAYETPALKKYVAEFPPAAVARDQLKYAVAELSTYDTGRVRKLLDDAIQAALTGKATPKAALAGAQTRADAPAQALPVARCAGAAGETPAVPTSSDARTPLAAAARLWLAAPAAGRGAACDLHALPDRRLDLGKPVLCRRPRRGRAASSDSTITGSMLDDPVFHQALFNNVWFALGTIPVAIALAILMALIADRALPGRVLMRMAYFTPTILPMIAVANIWLFFYTPGIGLIDQVLGALGLPGHNWLGDPDTVMWCLIVMMIWKEAGFFMIFYLAALQSISPDLREAASIEGASRWTYFRRVIFPLLMPTTLFVLITALINSFRVVDQLFIMTKGGPDNASMLLLYYIYETAFSFFDSAEAAAQTVFLLAVLIALAIAQYVLLEKRIHYR